MIWPMIVAILFGSPRDSMPSPLWIDFQTGYQANFATNTSGWLDLGLRMEWHERLLADVAWSNPFGYEARDFNMVSGTRPDPSRYGMRAFVGVRSNGAPAWLAAGAGWAFARLDTVGTYHDTRTISNLDGDVFKDKRTSWVWNDRVSRSEPYAMVEGGIGSGWFAIGCRTEYRFGYGVGLFVQIRGRPVGTKAN